MEKVYSDTFRRYTVSIWSYLPEHDPDNYDPKHPTVAEIDAWKNVQDAISKYNMIVELVR